MRIDVRLSEPLEQTFEENVATKFRQIKTEQIPQTYRDIYNKPTNASNEISHMFLSGPYARLTKPTNSEPTFLAKAMARNVTNGRNRLMRLNENEYELKKKQLVLVE